MSWFVAALVLALWAIRRRLAASICTTIGAIFLLLWSGFSDTSTFWQVSIWVVCGAAAFSWLNPGLRKSFWLPRYRERLEHWHQNAQTEGQCQTATGWLDAELFSGAPSWTRLSAMPATEYSDSELKFIEETVPDLLVDLDAWAIQQQADLPESIWQKLHSLGFFKLEQQGFSATALSEIYCALAASPGGLVLAETVVAGNSLGAELILAMGSDDQKATVAAAYANNRLMVDVWLEEKAGHEFQIRQNGENWFIDACVPSVLLAPKADVLCVFFPHPSADVTGGAKSEQFACLLLPVDHPSVSVGKRQAHQRAGLSYARVAIAGEIARSHQVGVNAAEVDDWTRQRLIRRQALVRPALEVGRATVAWESASAFDAMNSGLGRWAPQQALAMQDAALFASRVWAVDAVRRMLSIGLDLGERSEVCASWGVQEIANLSRQMNALTTQSLGQRLAMQGPSQPLPGFDAWPVDVGGDPTRINPDGLLLDAHPYLQNALGVIASEDALDELQRGHRQHRLLVAVNSFWLALADRVPMLGLGQQGPIEEAGHLIANIRRQTYRYAANLGLLAEFAFRQQSEAEWEHARRAEHGSRLSELGQQLFTVLCALHRHESQRRPLHEEAALVLTAELNFQRFEQLVAEEIAAFPRTSQRILARTLLLPFGLRSVRSGKRWRWAWLVLARDARTNSQFRRSMSRHDLNAGEPEANWRALFSALLPLSPVLNLLNEAVADDVIDDGPIDQAAAQAVTAGLIDEKDQQALEAWLEKLASLQPIDEFSDAQLRRGGSKTQRRVRARSSVEK